MRIIFAGGGTAGHINPALAGGLCKRKTAGCRDFVYWSSWWNGRTACKAGWV